MRREEALTVIQDKLTAAGGELSHNELVAQLEASGHGKAVPHILGLSQAKQLTPEVRVSAVPGEAPTLFYKVPGGDS